MSIDFSTDRWAECQDSYARWWNGTLERPVMNLSIQDRDPGRPKPDVPEFTFHSFYDDAVSPEQIVDVIAWQLERRTYLADGFPHVWINFGPGVIAAFLGLELVNGADTVWFHNPKSRPIEEINFTFDPDNPVFARLCSIFKACVERFEGLVQVGTTDLGGNLDIVSSFRPSQELLLDLYDSPEEVKRLTDQAHEMWWRYFDAINAILQPTNPGYTMWTPIFSETPFYMLQCDFAYMISPDMFGEFVRPELAKTCSRLDHPFYHLDGPGQLPHLKQLLQVDNLRGVQWIPGAGQPHLSHWPDVLRSIVKAGKKIQFFTNQDELGVDTLRVVAEAVKDPSALCMIGEGLAADERVRAEAVIKTFG